MTKRLMLMAAITACDSRGDTSLHELDVCAPGVWDDVDNRPVTNCEVGCAAGPNATGVSNACLSMCAPGDVADNDGVFGCCLTTTADARLSGTALVVFHECR